MSRCARGARLERAMYWRMSARSSRRRRRWTRLERDGQATAPTWPRSRDCFSQATVSTRSWMPAWTSGWRRGRGAADRAGGVDPQHRLARTAPSASARKSSGIIAPSKKSGALPMTTASMSSQVIWRRRGPAWRPRGRARPWRRRPGWPRTWSGRRRPRRRTRLLHPSALPLEDAHEVLLQHGPAVAWARARPASPSPDGTGHLGDAQQARRHHGLAASAPPPGCTPWRRRRGPSPAQDDLLVVNGAWSSATSKPPSARRPARRPAGRRGIGEVAGPGGGVDAVVDAGDPGGTLAQLAGPVAGGEDDGDTAVG
jgi:hypothetical protein